MNERIRVAVTGVGMRTPAGNDLQTVLKALLAARSVAATVPALVTARVPVTFACTVPDFDMDPYVAARERRQFDRGTMLALAAAVDAVSHAQLRLPRDRERIGVAVGTGMAGLAASEQVLVEHGGAFATVPAPTVPRIMANAAAARISMRLGTGGATLTYVASCASGATAIGEAALKIRAGELDVAVAGGADAAVSPLVMTAFAHIGALSRRNHQPEAASRPFDTDRDGFVMGEGAAMLVVERWDHAMARGAAILGEVLGFAANSEAHHIVAPLDDGSRAAACIRRAVADARLTLADIGHVNAHGTSTPRNDAAEARALAACFGDRCPPVTAPKGVVGHLIGGAGALEAIVTMATARAGVVAPVANFESSGVADLIDIVAGEPRAVGTAFGLSNSFGFGGHNACLVLGPP